MKSNLLNCVMIVFILLYLFLPMSLWAVEIVPRISDREIIEKLAVLEEGQKALRAEMKSGQEALNKRLNDLNNTILVLFGSLITLIVALFGYIAWDRRTMVKRELTITTKS